MARDNTVMHIGDVTPEEAVAFTELVPLINKALNPYLNRVTVDVIVPAARDVAAIVLFHPMAAQLLQRIAIDADRHDEHLGRLFARARQLVIDHQSITP